MAGHEYGDAMTRFGAALMIAMAVFLVLFGYLTTVDGRYAALLMTALFVLVCGYQSLCLVIRGKFEANGYELDWKKNPVEMSIWLIVCLTVPTMFVYELIINW